MAKIKSLMDIFEDELKDLYSAESQLLKALPKMAKAAQTESLKEALQSHLEETQEHVERLEQIGKDLDLKLTGKVCKAMKGLIEEGKEALEEESDNPALIDLLIIGAAQRVEHYEIAAYGTTRAIAEKLGLEDAVEILQTTLDEEGAADKKLTAISEEEVLDMAADGEGEESMVKSKSSEENSSRSARR